MSKEIQKAMENKLLSTKSSSVLSTLKRLLLKDRIICKNGFYMYNIDFQKETKE
jgi:hypothetical protein